MVNIFIALLTTVVLMVSYLSRQIELLALTCALTSSYLVFLSYDLMILARELRRRDGGSLPFLDQKRVRTFRNSIPRYITSSISASGKSLREMVIKISRLDQILIDLSGEVRRIDLYDKKSPKRELLEYFEVSAKALLKRFRCCGAAILFLRENGIEREHFELPKIELVGSEKVGSRFAQYLTSTAAAALKNGSGCFSLDHCQRLQQHDISVFGYHASNVIPFGREGGVCGLVWLGYSRDLPPTIVDRELLKQFVIAMEDELEVISSVSEMAARVNRAEQVSAEKNEMIAHISHDIRSPLGNIKAILHAIQLEGVSAGSEELVEAAIKNCDTLGEVVKDLLDYTRHCMGALSCDSKPISLHDLAAEVVSNFALPAKLKGIFLEYKSFNIEEIVMVDRGQVKRVISNLIGNAIKYTNFGTIQVEVNLDVETNKCSLSVSDSGVGMTSRQLEQLFTPFTRFSSSMADGMGLGLALSKILVELNGGKLSVESSPGNGSTFTVDFPLAVENLAKVLRSSEKGSSKYHNPSSEYHYEDPQKKSERPLSLSVIKILCIDDDHDCVCSLQRALQNYGWEALTAVKVGEAIGVINYEMPDLIICDANMPDGGAERILRWLQNVKLDIPVVIVSGEEIVRYDSEGVTQQRYAKLQRLGARVIYLKPLEIEVLAKQITSGILFKPFDIGNNLECSELTGSPQFDEFALKRA